MNLYDLTVKKDNGWGGGGRTSPCGDKDDCDLEKMAPACTQRPIHIPDRSLSADLTKT
jgi:hypothetical protein